jgi:hypothetical protein
VAQTLVHVDRPQFLRSARLAQRGAEVAAAQGFEFAGHGHNLAFMDQQAGIDLVGLAGVGGAISGVA